jgi:hypothetical protein
MPWKCHRTLHEIMRTKLNYHNKPNSSVAACSGQLLKKIVVRVVFVTILDLSQNVVNKKNDLNKIILRRKVTLMSRDVKEV